MRKQQRRIDESRGAAVCFSRALRARACRLTLTLHGVRHSLFLRRRRRGDDAETWTRRASGSANNNKTNKQHRGHRENVGCLCIVDEGSYEAYLLPTRYLIVGTGTAGGSCLCVPLSSIRIGRAHEQGADHL